MQTLSLKPNDLVGINYTRQIVIVNFRKFLDPDKVNIIPSTKTQENQLNKLIIPKKNLKQELEAIRTIDLLKKKLNIFFNALQKLRDYKLHNQTDEVILKQKQLNNHKKTIKKYFEFLKQDSNFYIEKLQNQINLVYKGNYCTCVRAVIF